MRVRAVLFDAHGVLIETAESVGRTYADFAREHGVDLPAWRVEDAFGRVLAGLPARVFPDAQLSDVPDHERAWWRECVRQTFQAADSTAAFDDFDAYFHRVYDWFAHAPAWALRPGCVEALAHLHAEGLALGVVSNFDHRLLDLLEELGIAGFLGAATTPSSCGAAKPDPGIFQTALSLLGVGAGEAVYVGHDPEKDVAGAAAAGLHPLVLAGDEGLAALPARIDRIANLGA